jgi:hypothetical protein
MIFYFDGFCQNDSTRIKIESMKNIKVDTIIQQKDSTNRILFEPLVGMLSDPVFYKEIGISLIGSNENPFFGLKLDYNPFIPLIYRHFFAEIGYRTDFNGNHIAEASIETKNLFYKRLKNFDLQVNYQLIYFLHISLHDFQKFTIGPIYRTTWTSYGLLFGQDSFERELGIDLFLKHRFKPFRSSKISNPYFIISGQIGYWDKGLNYDSKIDYQINYHLSCGVENRRLYDFSEFLINCRYVIFK